jgi:hypothetical protein
MAFVDELGKNNVAVNIINSVSEELEPAEVVLDIPIPKIELEECISPSLDINKSTKIELVKAEPPKNKEIKEVTKELPKTVKPALKKKVDFQQPIEKVIPETPLNNTKIDVSPNAVVPVSPTTTVVSALPALGVSSIIYLTKNYGFSVQTIYLLVILLLFGVFIFHQGQFPKN